MSTVQEIVNSATGNLRAAESALDPECPDAAEFALIGIGQALVAGVVQRSQTEGPPATEKCPTEHVIGTACETCAGKGTVPADHPILETTLGQRLRDISAILEVGSERGQVTEREINDIYEIATAR